MIPSGFIPPSPQPETLMMAEDLIKILEFECDEGKTGSDSLQRLQELTGNDGLTMDRFHEISGAMSYHDAAVLAFCPDPVAIENLDFGQFVWMCDKMLSRLNEPDFDYWFGLFCKNARNSRAGDLMFGPNPEWLERLKADKQVDAGTTLQTFQPSAQQLATEAWRSDAILL